MPRSFRLLREGLPPRRGSFVDHVGDLAFVAEVVEIALADLVTRAEQIGALRVADHLFSHVVFLGGDVREEAVLGQTAAGEKGKVGVVTFHGSVGILAHQGETVGKERAARGDGVDAVFRQGGERLDAVGDHRQIALRGKEGDQHVAGGGGIQKDHVAVLDKLRRLLGDLGFRAALLVFSEQKGNLVVGKRALLQHGAAVGALDQILPLQFLQIPSDGGLADVQKTRQLSHGDLLLLPEDLEDLFFSFLAHAIILSWGNLHFLDRLINLFGAPCAK